MTEQATQRHPTEINLHSKSRLLSIVFDDGQHFELPCEYLRVFSKAAEVRTMNTPVVGKENVNIEHIEPQGQYAVKIVFDDGHDTGIYSWDTLYSLGLNQHSNWQGYLNKLEAMGVERQEPQEGEKCVTLLYFAWMARKMRKESEQVTIPANVQDVAALLTWLGRRKRGSAPLFNNAQVRVTVNKQFTEEFTKLHDGDEIGFIPTSPTAPPTPDLI